MWQEIMREFIICLYKRSPCRNCLVRPCCRKKCDQIIRFDRALDPSPIGRRLVAWLLFYSIFIQLPWAITTIIVK